MAISSKIIFCKNIKLDRSNNNVLTLSESDMLTLVNSTGIKVAESNDYSFIGRGDRDAIDVSLTYSTLLGCNYVAFQNTNYNNKWYFAFIDKIEYINDGVSRVHYTVDIFATWWSYWSPKACFVVREHINNDTVGANLIDEGLALGDFVCNYVNTELNPFTTFKPVVGVSKIVTSPNAGGTETIPDYTEDGSIFNGIAYIVGDGDISATSHIVRAYDEVGESGDIQYIFMAPTVLLDRFTSTAYQVTGFSDFTLKYLFLKKATSQYQRTFDFNKPSTLGNYTPVNNKLLTFPYSYLLVDPHDGNSYTYNYEDFIGSKYSFRVDAVLTPGCSVKYTPQRYKGTLTTGYNYAFSGAKLPMCSWNSDAYTNWLTQNGVNLGFATLNQQEAMGLGGIASMALGGILMATGVGGMMGAGLIMGGATGIFSSMQSDFKASMLPNQVKGNQNTGDINYTLGLMNPICYEMSIKEEKARSIDSFFTRFGYKTNQLKLPNQTGRPYWNYVEIGKGEILAYQKPNVVAIPAQDLIDINKLYERGITLWHDHSNLGDYTLSNVVPTPTPTPTV